ncbi:carboxyl transferase domain-containing protein [Rhodococcoides kyotonense]|uniref:Acetyl-coenzyme A carboxylase carboxyl transferase subunits beta/alpha n=1 Tax=Rhodococcoides kyotonense TaxID=398843 RepID=A0A239M308_9NOCA|nr:carboxyl transferase domain-containing protein [Rhodococcus kyotonensis]SNT36672.1 acetyl-CoA carboxylase carboxyl transferase subunit beta [Rhodococcus kyotonensis]
MSATALPTSDIADSTTALLDEWDRDLVAGDPLEFPGYRAEKASHSSEAVRTGLRVVGGVPCAVIDSDFSVFGGSMGLVVGEKVSRAFRRAARERLPVVASVRTGGARMQEGMFSLVQMPRVVSAFNAHAAAGLLSLGYIGSPTAGGVFASWASLVDVRAVEPGATIGFAGPRVVEEMTGMRPPADSHNADSACRAGLVDAIVASTDKDRWIASVLGAVETPLQVPVDRPSVIGCESHRLGSHASAVERARAPRRPSGLEWAGGLTESWVELKGSDPSIRAGLATVSGMRCIVVAMDRHAHGDAKAGQGPEAYRLAQRAIRLAGKLSLPLLTLVDTPGAAPGPISESGGIAREIAETLRVLDELPTPSVCVCVGEGGSGGAIALAHTDRLFLLKDSVFSVIGPEAAAVILWRDSSRSLEAGRALKIGSAELADFGISDGTLPEPVSAAVLVDVRRRLVEAFQAAVPGERSVRWDGATRRWIHRS